MAQRYLLDSENEQDDESSLSFEQRTPAGNAFRRVLSRGGGGTRAAAASSSGSWRELQKGDGSRGVVSPLHLASAAPTVSADDEDDDTSGASSNDFNFLQQTNGTFGTALHMRTAKKRTKRGSQGPPAHGEGAAFQRDDAQFSASSRSGNWMRMNPAAVALEDAVFPGKPPKRSGEPISVFPGRRGDFSPDQAGVLQRKYKKPSVEPAQDIDVVREAVAWRERLTNDAVRLQGQPWYKFAELVAGKAGVPLDKLVHLQGTAPARFNENPQHYRLQLSPDEGQGPGGGSSKKVFPGSAPPLADDTLSERNAYLDDALELELAGPTTGNVGAPLVGWTALERRQADDVDAWAKQARVTGVAFLTPIFSSSRDEALVRVKHVAPWLTGAPLDAFTRDPSVRVWFAIATASLINVSRFTGGQAPLRAGDYEKYVDRLDEAIARIAEYTWSARDRVFRLERRPGQGAPRYGFSRPRRSTESFATTTMF